MKVLSQLAQWFDDRTGLKKPLVALATHPVPPKSRWAYVLGTAVMSSFIVQVITGVALATIYVSSAGSAYESIKYISEQAPLGGLLRGMHYFGASAMILFVGLHMLRTYLYGSYKFPRELNWVSGVFLLFLTVAMGFSGQVLRWDQTSVWTVAVGAEQALRMPLVGKWLAEILMSGGTIGSSTLSHFFSLHVFIFPGLLIALMCFHLYLVLHNGISQPPTVGEPVDPATYREQYSEMLKREGVPFWPNAAWRDMIFSSAVIIGVLSLALWVGPPHVEKPPDPSLIQAEPRPDWYLLWYFALLALLPHKAEDWIIILFPLLLALALLAVPFISNRGERSIKRRPWAPAIVVFAIGSILALWREGIKEPWTPVFDAQPLDIQTIGATSGDVYDGAQLFNTKGCLFCHAIAGRGGKRGPDLTQVADRLTQEQMVIRIINGGDNMPAYAGNITPKELNELVSFLRTRKQAAISATKQTNIE
jgi:ubiquinol-cytochrome c reductase cytochrome b subunit